jgi:hypothetical protein
MIGPARERLTWHEICARYPNKWVTITDLEWEEGDEDNGALVAAAVLGHSKKRWESLQATRYLRAEEHVTE